MNGKKNVWMVGLLAGLVWLLGAGSAAADEGRKPVDVGPGKIGVQKKLGLGLVGGTLSGVNLKYFMTSSQALQLTVGGGPWGIGLTGEYLVHPFVLTEGNGVSIPLYAGVGVGVGNYYYYNYRGLNVHIPLGIAFELEEFPLDLFAQLEPGIGLGSGYAAFFIGGSGGVRFYF